MLIDCWCLSTREELCISCQYRVFCNIIEEAEWYDSYIKEHWYDLFIKIAISSTVTFSIDIEHFEYFSSFEEVESRLKDKQNPIKCDSYSFVKLLVYLMTKKGGPLDLRDKSEIQFIDSNDMWHMTRYLTIIKNTDLTDQTETLVYPTSVYTEQWIMAYTDKEFYIPEKDRLWIGLTESGIVVDKTTKWIVRFHDQVVDQLFFYGLVIADHHLAERYDENSHVFKSYKKMILESSLFFYEVEHILSKDHKLPIYTDSNQELSPDSNQELHQSYERYKRIYNCLGSIRLDYPEISILKGETPERWETIEFLKSLIPKITG